LQPPPHLIVHARKCILKGLSPKQNRSIPPLNYDRVYELSRAFPNLPITINGGFTEVNQIKSVLEKVDGCMIGRKGNIMFYLYMLHLLIIATSYG
jgi:tRNA-dihydrouridine synthase A